MKNSYIKPQKDHNIGIRGFLIAIYIVFSFFEYYTLMNFGSITRYFIFLVIVMVFLTAEKMHIRHYHYATVGWLMYKYLSLAWTPSYGAFGTHALTETGFVILLVSITALDECESLANLLEKATLYCSALLGVLSLLFSDSFEGHTERKVLTLFGRQLDPNNIAAFLLFGVAIGVHYILYQKKHKLLYIAIVAINSFTTLLTGSRAALLSVALIIAISFFCVFDPKVFKENARRAILLLTIILLAGIVMYILLPDEVSTRLFVFEDYEGGSSRDTIWAHGLKILSNPIHLLMGSGWGGYRADGGPGSLHNTFLSITCDTGLLGLSVFFVPVCYAVFKMLKKKNPLPLTMFIAGMAPAFFIESINKRFFWNTILYIYIAYNCYLKQESLSQNENKRIRRY